MKSLFNKKLLFTFFYAIAIILIIQSCKHEVPPAPPAPTPDPVCFSEEVLPLFQTYCSKSGCHSTASHQGTYILNEYSKIVSHGLTTGNAQGSLIYQTLLKTGSGKMPKIGHPDLSSVQIKKIKDWIDLGALNTINCGANCDTTKFTYAADVRPILDLYCTGCHAGVNAQGGVQLDTYIDVNDQAINNRDAFIGSITHDPNYSAMPKYAIALSNCKIRKIIRWINAGAPNN